MAKKASLNNYYSLLKGAAPNIQDLKKVIKPEQQSTHWKNGKK